MSNTEDKILLKSIMSDNERDRNNALKIIYKMCFPQIRSFILNKNGDKEQVKDVFQDAMSIFYNNLLNDKFDGRSSIATYIFSISKNCWYIMFNSTKQYQAFSANELNIEETEQQMVNINKLKSLIDELGDSCKHLLIDFYFKKESMQEIKETFNLGSIQAAKTKKLRCMKHLIDIVQKKRLKQDDFIM